MDPLNLSDVRQNGLRMMGVLLGFLRKDLRVFAADRSALVMSMIVPMVIASILGWLESKSVATRDEKQRVVVYVADQDHSTTSRAFITRLSRDSSLTVHEAGLAESKEAVRTGRVSVAAVIPAGFGQFGSLALQGGPKPTVTVIDDPSKPIDGQIVEACLMEDGATAIASQTFGSLAGDAGAPLSLKEEVGAAQEANWSSAAHRYSGFGLQGLLFFAIEAAVALSRERRLGIWNRLRAAPVSPSVFVLSRAISSTVLALAIILFMFGTGAVLFHIRVLGSPLGFAAVALATALMAATFGLLVATIGKTENQSRALSILFIMVMLATGGAWFPIEQMPEWVQTGAKYLPVRWAVEGFDAATWRGLSLGSTLQNAGILLAFSAVFALGAVWRFRSTKFS